MSANIINCLEIQKDILIDIESELNVYSGQCEDKPGLVTILVGNNSSSRSYISKKIEIAQSLGFHDVFVNLKKDVSEIDLISCVEKYNKDMSIDGILVQLPLPEHINVRRVLNTIDPKKDVDGFHPTNVGHLLTGSGGYYSGVCGYAPYIPCTPKGILELILRTGIKTESKEVLMVGASNIVGKPMGLLMVQEEINSTVTIAHKATKNLKEHCKKADILIVAIGVPKFIKGDWIKPGAVVIDVGVTNVGQKINSKGKKISILEGDVDFESAKEVAGYITPVPGGVGPMTVVMLMKNTLDSFKSRKGFFNKPI